MSEAEQERSTRVQSLLFVDKIGGYNSHQLLHTIVHKSHLPALQWQYGNNL